MGVKGKAAAAWTSRPYFLGGCLGCWKMRVKDTENYNGKMKAHVRVAGYLMLTFADLATKKMCLKIGKILRMIGGNENEKTV